MHSRSLGYVGCVVALLCATSSAFAYSVAPPRRHSVHSPNKAFVVDLDPIREVNTIYTAGDPTRPLWSFPGDVWLSKAHLSNDGTVVVIVHWPFVQHESLQEYEAVEFWYKDGKFASHRVTDLCPNPMRTSDAGGGPVGDFWRTWYTDSSFDGERLWLRTTGDYDYEFRAADGAITGRWRNTMVFNRALGALLRGSIWAWVCLVGGVLLIGGAARHLVRRARKRLAGVPPAAS